MYDEQSMDDARSMVEGLNNDGGRMTTEEDDIIARAKGLLANLNLDENDASQAAQEEEKKQNEM